MTPTPDSDRRTAARRLRGLTARQAGRTAELQAALWLMLKGWRIVALRLKTPQAEIDILARRRTVLAVIEVKRRRSLDVALASVTLGQRRRLRAAAEGLAGRRRDLAGLTVRLDLVASGPLGWPLHCPDAWPQDGPPGGRR